MLIETTQQMQVIFLHLETDLERTRPIASQTESTTWLKLKFSCVHEMFAADESCDQWNDEWSAAYGVSALTQALSSPEQARFPPPVFLPFIIFVVFTPRTRFLGYSLLHTKVRKSQLIDFFFFLQNSTNHYKTAPF